MGIKLGKDEINRLLEIESQGFSTYVSPIINLANYYAHGTRPEIVGQMTDLIQEFQGRSLTEWEKWYGDVSDDEIEAFSSIGPVSKKLEAELPKAAFKEQVAIFGVQPLVSEKNNIGYLGEHIVLKYEQDVIAQIRPDKLGLIKIVSNDTELGYDIQSLEPNNINIKKMIEVKTTKRTFPPESDVLTFFPMSSNEWVTAKNHKEKYYIYRVFITNEDPKIYIIKNPAQKYQRGLIMLEPLEYRVIVKRGSGNYAQ